MTRKELIQRIEHGDDFMFKIGNEQYGILTWCAEEKGICIYCHDEKKNQPVYYPTPQTLVNEYMIDGKSLGQRADEIEVTQYTLVSEPPESWEN